MEAVPQSLRVNADLAISNGFTLAQNEGIDIYSEAFDSRKESLKSDADSIEAENFFKRNKNKSAGSLDEFCADSPICTIGERHSSTASKDYLADNMESLAQIGFTHIGFEMIKQRDQQLLDDYVFGKGDKEARARLLTGETFLAYDYAPGVPEGYLRILDAIRQTNLKTGSHLRPLALEIDYDLTDKSDSEMERRNRAWADKIEQLVRDEPSARVLTYSGGAHLGFLNGKNTLNKELAERGLPSTIITLDSAQPNEQPTNDSRVAAHSANVSGIDRPYSYRIAPGREGKRSDFGIYIPWKNPPEAPFGKEVTPRFMKSSTRTGEVFFDGDTPLTSLRITTDRDNRVISLAVRDDDEGVDVLNPNLYKEPDGPLRKGWFLMNNGDEESIRYLKNGEQILKITLKDRRLVQVRNKTALLYPAI